MIDTGLRHVGGLLDGLPILRPMTYAEMMQVVAAIGALTPEQWERAFGHLVPPEARGQP